MIACCSFTESATNDWPAFYAVDKDVDVDEGMGEDTCRDTGEEDTLMATALVMMREDAVIQIGEKINENESE